VAVVGQELVDVEAVDRRAPLPAVVAADRPRALEAAEPTADADTARLRRQTSWLARVNALLALLVVALAVVLVRGAPW